MAGIRARAHVNVVTAVVVVVVVVVVVAVVLVVVLIEEVLGGSAISKSNPKVSNSVLEEVLGGSATSSSNETNAESHFGGCPVRERHFEIEAERFRILVLRKSSAGEPFRNRTRKFRNRSKSFFFFEEVSGESAVSKWPHRVAFKNLQSPDPKTRKCGFRFGLPSKSELDWISKPSGSISKCGFRLGHPPKNELDWISKPAGSISKGRSRPTLERTKCFNRTLYCGPAA